MKTFLLTAAITSILSSPPLAFAQEYDPDFLCVYDLVSSRIDDEGPALARTLVRLAFHDSFGGVDALVNEEDPEHNGLADTINQLDDIWECNEDGDLSAFSSKADFFAWSYIAAFYHTIVDNDKIPWVPLRTGRNTHSSNRPENIPPNSEFGGGGQAAIVEYFSTTFGMTEREFAVLMGAHTLGGAAQENSGFVGNWKSSEDIFNGGYYNNLLKRPFEFNGGDDALSERPIGWEQVVAGDGKHQWRVHCKTNAGTADGEGCNLLMLNIDMNLLRNLDPYMAADGSVTLPPASEFPADAPPECGNDGRIWDTCFPERTTDSNTVVKAFNDFDDLIDFLDEFAKVYDTMISRVTDGASLSVAELQKPECFPADILPRCSAARLASNAWNGIRMGARMGVVAIFGGP